MITIRKATFNKLEALLQEASDNQQEIGRTIIRMINDDEGHRDSSGRLECVQHDVKWTLQLIQPHLIQMAHDLWDTKL